MLRKNDPVGSFNFLLRVDGIHDLPCKSIKGFEYEEEYEYIREGGLNDYVHMRKKQATRPHTFQVERYVGTDTVDYLAIGNHFSLPIILLVSRTQDDFNNPVRTYIFIGCTVTKKSYGQMEALQSDLLVETTTITYQQLLCINK